MEDTAVASYNAFNIYLIAFNESYKTDIRKLHIRFESRIKGSDVAKYLFD